MAITKRIRKGALFLFRQTTVKIIKTAENTQNLTTLRPIDYLFMK
jgi:hypothetical protein